MGIKLNKQTKEHSILSPETDPLIYGHLIYNKGDTEEQWRKEVFLINGAVRTGYPYKKTN